MLLLWALGCGVSGVVVESSRFRASDVKSYEVHTLRLKGAGSGVPRPNAHFQPTRTPATWGCILQSLSTNNSSNPVWHHVVLCCTMFYYRGLNVD